MTARTFVLAGLVFFAIGVGRAATVWVEGEKPSSSKVTRHPWWYDQVQVNEFSGGNFISHWDKEKPGEVVYSVQAANAGKYELWVRANPMQATMFCAVNGGEPVAVPMNRNEQSMNVAADQKPDVRFLAWMKVGSVSLKAGTNEVAFRFTSANNHHGMLDCFVLSSDGSFEPDGKRKPGEKPATVEEGGWFAFNPSRDTFGESAMDLRWLNEKVAGEHGWIAARGDEFVHSGNGRPVRFWAVNGPPHEASGESLKLASRRLAKYGVNLVRPHGAVFDKAGEVDLKKVAHLQEVVKEMKAQGIYSHLSFYFPLWFTPAADHPWLKGYDGKTHPFAALLFNPEFQAKHREWMRVLLTTPDQEGRKLIDEPAVFGLEIQNEDSFFFWTFDRIPDGQLRILESQFGEWLKRKHGSIEAAFAKWNRQSVKRDAFAEGRVGFRPLWNMFNEKTTRDRETAAFLFETQQRFYAETVAYLRGLGFKGLITPSNWTTASPEVFGPLEKWSYTTGDFVDRHGYFAGTHKGENAAWSLRAGHTYADRSALRFDAGEPGKPRQFEHPVMDPSYAGMPSMISETTWNRPNRYRTEAPLYLAIYGALQGSDAIVHFAFDGVNWATKPNFWMQPWTLMAPSQVGQFPAAALIYRQRMVSMGETLGRVNLNTNDLLSLKGTPLPQDASFDELRLKDVPKDREVKPGQRIDPLIHYAGRTEVAFSGEPSRAELKDLGTLIDRKAQVVRSSTAEVKLDYGKGRLVLNAAAAQGASGNLKAAGWIELRDVEIECDEDLAHIVVVALDGEPLSSTRRMLLQVMTEEKNSGFQTEAIGQGMHRVTNVGRDPWMVKEIRGTVRFKKRVVIQPLDFNGYPAGEAMTGTEVKLAPKTVYYEVK